MDIEVEDFDTLCSEGFMSSVEADDGDNANMVVTVNDIVPLVGNNDNLNPGGVTLHDFVSHLPL